jgi:hypothetical protein
VLNRVRIKIRGKDGNPEVFEMDLNKFLYYSQNGAITSVRVVDRDGILEEVFTLPDWSSEIRVASPPSEIQVVWPSVIQLASRERHGVLELIALVLPSRLYVEDLGDALETLAQLERLGAPLWKRRVKAGSTCILLLLNALREVVSALRGNAGSAAQRKGERR